MQQIAGYPVDEKAVADNLAAFMSGEERDTDLSESYMVAASKGGLAGVKHREAPYEAKALERMTPGFTEPPLSPNPMLAAEQKKQRAHRDKRRAMYAGEAPKPVTGEPVWEIGQGEPDWSGRKKPQEKRYYVVGKRPLDAPVMKGLYGETVNDTPVEHWQFIADDGSNKGLFPQGFKSDDTSLIHAYGYQDTQKYDAAIMDQAMDEVEKEMIKHSGGEKEVYAFLKNNCQNYVNTVLDRAREIAKNKEVSLITD